MREKIVGTRVGSVLLSLRQWRELRSISVKNPEVSAIVANGIIADRLISKICPSGGVFLDVGAHIGSVLASVHLSDRTIKIIAIEADPRKARNLRSRFGFCSVFNVAVGEKSANVDFFIDEASSGYNTIVPNQVLDGRAITVQLEKLDVLLAEETVDVIKIDIEGAELGALRGGHELINRCRPVIMFESSGTSLNSLGYSPELVWNWFGDQGYEVFTPDRVAHDGPPLSISAFLDGHFYPFRSRNYFAIHRSKRDEVRDRARLILNVRSN